MGEREKNKNKHFWSISFMMSHTVKLGYYMQLGTGHFCSLHSGFVITGLIFVIKLPSRLDFNCVLYNWLFVRAEFVKFEFRCIFEWFLKVNPAGTHSKWFEIASLVYLKKCAYHFSYDTFFGNFFPYASTISKMTVQALHSVIIELKFATLFQNRTQSKY